MREDTALSLERGSCPKLASTIPDARIGNDEESEMMSRINISQ